MAKFVDAHCPARECNKFTRCRHAETLSSLPSTELPCSIVDHCSINLVGRFVFAAFYRKMVKIGERCKSTSVSLPLLLRIRELLDE